MTPQKNSLSHKSLEKDFSAVKAHIIYPKLWFARFDTTEDEEPDEWFHPSDINFPNEMDCPNCNRITADAVCECRTIIQHTFKRLSLCN